MARRGLRAAAESLALVGYGLLTLDVVGADNAGWFGDLSTAGAAGAARGGARSRRCRRRPRPYDGRRSAAHRRARSSLAIGTALVAASGLGWPSGCPSPRRWWSRRCSRPESPSRRAGCAAQVARPRRRRRHRAGLAVAGGRRPRPALRSPPTVARAVAAASRLAAAGRRRPGRRARPARRCLPPALRVLAAGDGGSARGARRRRTRLDEAADHRRPGRPRRAGRRRCRVSLRPAAGLAGVRPAPTQVVAGAGLLLGVGAAGGHRRRPAGRRGEPTVGRAGSRTPLGPVDAELPAPWLLPARGLRAARHAGRARGGQPARRPRGRRRARPPGLGRRPARRLGGRGARAATRSRSGWSSASLLLLAAALHRLVARRPHARRPSCRPALFLAAALVVVAARRLADRGRPRW